MAGWAKYGLIKSIRKFSPFSPSPRLTVLQGNEKDIKAGIAGCVEKLKSMVSFSDTSLMGSS